jgi:hypothetical protein
MDVDVRTWLVWDVKARLGLTITEAWKEIAQS